MPKRAWMSRIRRKIWLWMVTSSAVVGSSASRMSGLLAMAMAIMIRWRMPPENWCGYWSKRRSGSGMPTRRRSSMARRFASAPRDPRVAEEDLGDLPADAHGGVQRAHRVLEDHRDGVAADGGEGLVGGAGEVLAAEADLARGDLAGRARGEAEDGLGGDALAAAALADDGEDLAGGERERDVAHGADVADGGVEDDGEVADLEEGLAGHAGARSCEPKRQLSSGELPGSFGLRPCGGQGARGSPGRLQSARACLAGAESRLPGAGRRARICRRTNPRSECGAVTLRCERFIAGASGRWRRAGRRRGAAAPAWSARWRARGRRGCRGCRASP